MLRAFTSFVLLPSALVFGFKTDVFSQNASNTFQRYLSIDTTIAKKVIQTSDKGYIAAGAIIAGSNLWDMFLVKTDFAGNTQFAKQLHVANTDQIEQIKDVIQTPDKGYTCLGISVPSTSAGNTDVVVVRFDSCGNLQWYKSYGSPFSDIPQTIIRTSDGKYVITGYTSSGPANADRNMMLLKLDGNGNFIWSRSYGRSNREEFGLDVIESAGGGYAMTGRVISGNTIVIKTDTAGAIVWGYTYALGGGKTIRQTSNGDYIVFVGGGGAFTSGGRSLCILKLNSSGTVLWYKIHDINTTRQTGLAGGCLTSDRGMAIVGYTASRTQDINNMELLVIKADKDGNVLWGNTYNSGQQLIQNGYAQQESGQIAETSDLGFIFGGESWYPNTLKHNMYLLKTDENGRTGCNYPIAITTTTSSPTRSVFTNEMPNTNAIAAVTIALTNVTPPSTVFTQNNFQCAKVYGQTDSIPSEGIYGPINVCYPSTNTYSVPNLGAGHQYNWAVTSGTIVSGNGTPSISVNCVAQGINNLTLTITSPCGNVTQLGLDINTSCDLPPTAGFQTSDSSICAKVDFIRFTDNSTNGPTSWLWTFPGGSPATSNLQNPPPVYYSSAGSFSAQLIAYNSNGSDTVIFANLINVIASPPNPVITQNMDTLRCSFDPSYTSYQWYDGNSIIPGATGTFYVATQSGNYSVIVSNQNGCSAKDEINITLAGLSMLASAEKIRIYPNPAADKLVISVGSSIDKSKTKLEIYNMLGEIMYSGSLFTLDGLSKELTISSFAKGIYYVQLKNGNACLTQKFIKE